MKPTWDELGDEFDSSKKVLIAEVDCTVTGNDKLCEAQGVTGYPTIKYYAGNGKQGELYEGERDLKSLRAFAKNLGPACGPTHIERCDAESKKKLESYLAMPFAELSELEITTKGTLEGAKQKHEALMKAFQEQYEKSDAEMKALRAEHEGPLKLMLKTLQHRQEQGGTPKAEL